MVSPEPFLIFTRKLNKLGLRYECTKKTEFQIVHTEWPEVDG